MKLAFIASFIIGGLLWLSVFQVNNNIFSHSGRQTLYQSVKVTNEAFAQLMERDLRRVGFDAPPADGDDPDDPKHGIITALADEFEFVSRFAGPVATGETQNPQRFVSWKVEVDGDETFNFTERETCIEEDGSPLRFTRTERNYPIDAADPGQEISYEVGAKCFTFKYFNANMQEIFITSNNDAQFRQIRHIRFELLSESEHRYGDRNERHALERTITPRNLTLNLQAGS